jgi:hypothetical protein
MAKLPEPQRVAAFEAALEEYLTSCSAEEAAFWRAVRDSSADPFADYSETSTSTTSSS